MKKLIHRKVKPLAQHFTVRERHRLQIQSAGFQCLGASRLLEMLPV